MNKKFLAVVATALLGASVTANAVPINYGATYSAIQGPNGTGSFAFDSAIGAITNFSWDFGGVTGSAGNTFGTQAVFGDTIGRFLFEILSQTDVHSGANCITSGCSAGFGILTGSGPFGATSMTISGGNLSVASYVFQGGSSAARGTVSIRAITVPEPGMLALLGIAIPGLVLAIRRRRTQ